jgi:multicomponent Na+:H+ antiporter subunit E
MSVGRLMRWLGLFVLLVAIWLVWSGLYKPLVVGLGVASCALCVWVTMRMHPVGGESFDARPLWRIAGYLPWLLKEIFLANLKVIRLVLKPRMTIEPVLITLTASQRSALGRVVYGNSITLTPGTLTVDMDGDELTVHALTRAGAEQLRAGEMDARVTRLEGPR